MILLASTGAFCSFLLESSRNLLRLLRKRKRRRIFTLILTPTGSGGFRNIPDLPPESASALTIANGRMIRRRSRSSQPTSSREPGRPKEIDRSALPSSEQLNYDLYLDLLQTSEEGLQYGDDPLPFRQVVPGSIWLPLSQMGGIPQGAAETLASMPNQTVSDYEDILARLEALPKHSTKISASPGWLKHGYSHPKIILRDVPNKSLTSLPPILRERAPRAFQ